jgi:hypothetical protein
MDLQQLLIFELGARCNLGQIHTACPNQSPERFAGLDTSRTLDDETIVRTAAAMYGRFGFRGLVGWHYYNEPTLEEPRMFRLMDAIRAAAPQAEFLLWTNGTRLPRDPERLARYRAFAQIHVTDYSRDGCSPVADALARLPEYCRHRHALDARLEARASAVDHRPCARMFTEFIVDACGYVHLCCHAWRGPDAIGNLLDEPLEALVERWQKIRAKISGGRMAADAPQVCLRCAMRHDRPTEFVPALILPTREELARLRERLAVVFVHYKMPPARLRDHFLWNEAIYRHPGLTVYVVADRDLAGEGLPSYARTVVFDEQDLPQVDGGRRFSLARTKNAGIAAALADGCELILVADSDNVFPRETWTWMLKTPVGEARMPVYLMRTWPDRTSPQDHLDPGCTGTLAMRAEHWARIRFDGATWGYGAEDGILLLDLQKSKIKILRNHHVFHMAHTPGHNPRRLPGNGNAQCWGRDTGFNPDNVDANRKILEQHR